MSLNYSSFEIPFKDVDKLLMHVLPFNSCQVMWKYECFSLERFKESLMYAEEWELYSRVLMNKNSGVSINKTLFYGRKHPNSNSGEFFKGNSVRIDSNVESIKLVVANLKKNGLLNLELKKYFIRVSIAFQEYNLKKDLIALYEDNTFNYELYYFKINIKNRLYKLKRRILK